MAFTQAQIDALTSAIALGVTTVEYDGKRTTYASIPQMLMLRDRMIREVSNSGDAVRPPVARASVFRRG